jgi:hypothetical protein
MVPRVLMLRDYLLVWDSPIPQKQLSRLEAHKWGTTRCHCRGQFCLGFWGRNHTVCPSDSVSAAASIAPEKGLTGPGPHL